MLARRQALGLEAGIDPAHVVVHHAVVRGDGCLFPGQHGAHLGLDRRQPFGRKSVQHVESSVLER
ncbi:MAG: hypothetical protein KDE01_29615, partial [Caldilineaceae bacterium]|nr:hypothetical protein [Caldilineaceae bacterium]